MSIRTNLFDIQSNKVHTDPRYAVTIEELYELGAYYGHSSKKRNPAMDGYIYKSSNGRDIIDLTQTVILLRKALHAIYLTSKRGGEILVYVPKPELSEYVKQIGEITDIHYVTTRWLGGLLTNFYTVNKSLNTLANIERVLESVSDGQQEASYNTKKEKLILERNRNNLLKSLGGVRFMKKLPDLLITTDSRAGRTAMTEAYKLGIPVICIVDSNSNPKNITCPIPMNDDAEKIQQGFLNLISKAILAGIADSGVEQQKNTDKIPNSSTGADVELEEFATATA